jgi:hypothetical protein
MINQAGVASMVTKLAKVGAIAVAFYLLVMCNPIQFAIADMLQTGANDNGYSPYTMYERCHPAQFHIPTGLSC